MLYRILSGRSLIYKSKRFGPRIEPWGTSTLNAHSEDVYPSKTTRSLLILGNDEIRWRRPACQTLSKAFAISSAAARVAAELLKALAILSFTTVKRSAVEWEARKLH